MPNKPAVVVMDHALPHEADAIQEAGFTPVSLVLWQDRCTPSSWAVQAAGYEVRLRMNPNDSLEKIEKALREATTGIAGIIPTNEPTEEIACRLAERFHVPHNSPEIAAIRWNKAKVKELAGAASLRVPKFRVCYSQKDIIQAAQEFSLPVIIKTPFSSASVNVFKCVSKESLFEKHNIITTTPDDFGIIPNYSVIEEYINGTEYQINTFSDGTNFFVTDIWLTKKIDNKFASNLYYDSWIVGPEYKKYNEIVAYAINVARATGITYGPAHIEVKIDSKGPALIEAHARFGGGRQPEILREISNFDPFRATLEVFTRGQITLPVKVQYSKFAAVADCPSVWNCEKGTVHGIEQIRKLPSYYSESLLYGPYPQRIVPSKDFSKFPLAIYLIHKEQSQLQQDLEQVHSLFTITCED